MTSPNGPTPSHPVVMDTLTEATEAELELVAMFGATSFDVFHVGDTFEEQFDDASDLRGHLASMAGELQSEFFERDLFEGLLPTDDRVKVTTVEGESVTYVEVFCDQRGMLLAVDPDASVPPLAEAASKLLGGSI